MNKEQAEEKKQIKKEIRDRINKGVPKQQILEELSQQHKDKITIIKQLESTPSKMMIYKYRLYNYGLAVLLLGVLVLDILLFTKHDWGIRLLDVIACMNIVLDVVLLIGVLLYRIENYSWIAARAVVSLLQIMVTHAYYHQPIDILTFIVLALVVISFFLGLYLSVKLCPPRIPKTIEVVVEGDEKINKTVYVFPD